MMVMARTPAPFLDAPDSWRLFTNEGKPVRTLKELLIWLGVAGDLATEQMQLEAINDLMLQPVARFMPDPLRKELDRWLESL